MGKKMTYEVLSAGLQVQSEYGYRRFLKGEIIKLDPEHPLTMAFLKGGMIIPHKEEPKKKKK